MCMSNQQSGQPWSLHTIYVYLEYGSPLCQRCPWSPALLLVELCYWSLPADLEGVMFPLFSAVHFEQIRVEHLSGAQSRHQVIKLTTLFCFVCFPLLLPLFFQLEKKTTREREMTQITHCYPVKNNSNTLCILSNEWFLMICSNLRLRECPPLLFLLASGHVLVVLFGLGERSDESVEDPEEHVRLQFGQIFSKVPQCLCKLQRERDTMGEGGYLVYLLRSCLFAKAHK